MWCIVCGYTTRSSFGCPTSKELVPALNHSITYTNQTVVNCLNDLLCTEMRVGSRKERGGGGDGQREKERGGEGGKDGRGGREKERMREGKRKGRSHMMF